MAQPMNEGTCRTATHEAGTVSLEPKSVAGKEMFNVVLWGTVFGILMIVSGIIMLAVFNPREKTTAGDREVTPTKGAYVKVQALGVGDYDADMTADWGAGFSPALGTVGYYLVPDGVVWTIRFNHDPRTEQDIRPGWVFTKPAGVTYLECRLKTGNGQTPSIPITIHVCLPGEIPVVATSRTGTVS